MRIVSLFSGAGGLDLGFIRAGHCVIWANDNYLDAVETYRLNIGKHIVCADIKTIDSHEIPDCDVVVGGFPCQGFSVANTKRKTTDIRNQLYEELLRVVKDKQPRYFLAENVKGILSLGKGKILNLIMDDFHAAGYRVQYKVLNAADYGVPQRRMRVIFLGTRNDIKNGLSYPEPTHCNPTLLETPTLFNDDKEPWLSIGAALADIPSPEDAPHIPNHTYSKYKLRFNGYMGHREIDPTKPAPTVTGRGDNKGGVVVLHHPNNKRRMSVRELAAAQAFPLDYEFFGTQSSAYRQVANAVPPLMAEAIARQFPLE